MHHGNPIARCIHCIDGDGSTFATALFPIVCEVISTAPLTCPFPFPLPPSQPPLNPILIPPCPAHLQRQTMKSSPYPNRIPPHLGSHCPDHKRAICNPEFCVCIPSRGLHPNEERESESHKAVEGLKKGLAAARCNTKCLRTPMRSTYRDSKAEQSNATQRSPIHSKA